MISEYHNYLARDANLRFTFTRFFMHVYSQVDVNVFNDLLRGSVSCGVGIVLKAVLTELTMWTKAVNLPPAVADSLVRCCSCLGLRFLATVETNRGCAGNGQVAARGAQRSRRSLSWYFACPALALLRLVPA